MKILRKVIRKDPFCPSPYLMVARIQKKTNPRDALKYCNLSLHNNADSADVMPLMDSLTFNLAQYEYENKRLEQALNLFTKIAANSSLYSLAKVKRHQILLDLSDLAQREKHFNEAITFLNQILSEEYLHSSALNRKINCLEAEANTLLEEGNDAAALALLLMAVECSMSAETHISCYNYSARTGIHLNSIRPTAIANDLRAQIVLLDDLLSFPIHCSEVQEIQQEVKLKKLEVQYSLVGVLHNKKKYKDAYYLLLQTPLEIADASLIASVKQDYSRSLLENSKDENSLRTAVILCDELLLDQRFIEYFDQVKELRKEVYIALLAILRNGSNSFELMDYINRLQIEYPDDAQIQDLRSSIILEFGIEVNRKRHYEKALTYYSEASESNSTNQVLSTYYLAKLHEQSFDLKVAKVKMQEIIQDLQNGENQLITTNAKKDLSRYQAIMDENEEALEYLFGFYCTEEYDSIRYATQKDNSYYNLQSNSGFQRWLSGVRRVKISNLCANIKYNPDGGDFFDTGEWEGPDAYAQLLNSRTNIIKGEFNPCWKSWSAVRDFKVNQENFNVYLYDHDPGFDPDLIGTIKTNNICQTGYQTAETVSAYRASIGYYISDASEAPYTMSYVYSRKSPIQVGFEAIYCSAKVFMDPGPFFFVNLAEGVLVDETIQNNETAIENAIVKTLQKIFVRTLEKNIRNAVKTAKIANCFFKAINDLKEQGWIKRNFSENGDRIVTPFLM